MAQQGTLAISDWNMTRLNETADLLCKQAGARGSEPTKVDVSDREAMKTWARPLRGRGSSVGVNMVINNAGVSVTGVIFEMMSYDDFDWIVGINLWRGPRHQLSPAPDRIW
ncbi:MAG: hypothetical protein R2693_07340 [Nocardioidaceae bacterium]